MRSALIGCCGTSLLLLAAHGAVADESNAKVVREAQTSLKQEGFDPGPVDGVAGPRTLTALASYQRAQGLRPTGRLDEETRVRLDVDQRVFAPDASHTRSMQAALLDAGHDPGPIDGIKGPRTSAAVRRYVAVPAPTAPDAPRGFPSDDAPRIAPDPVAVVTARPQSP